MCAGWCVAKLASKAKNKNNVTMVMSLVFMGVYYLVFDKAQKIINAFITNVVILGQSVKKSLYPLYMFGKIGEVDILSAIIYAVITIGILALVYRLLTGSFITIVSASKNSRKAVYKEKNIKRKSRIWAVAGKEFKRFPADI